MLLAAVVPTATYHPGHPGNNLLKKIDGTASNCTARTGVISYALLESFRPFKRYCQW